MNYREWGGVKSSHSAYLGVHKFVKRCHKTAGLLRSARNDRKVELESTEALSVNLSLYQRERVEFVNERSEFTNSGEGSNLNKKSINSHGKSMTSCGKGGSIEKWTLSTPSPTSATQTSLLASVSSPLGRGKIVVGCVVLTHRH